MILCWSPRVCAVSVGGIEVVAWCLPSLMPLRERLNPFSASTPRTFQAVPGVERLWVAASTVGDGDGDFLVRRFFFETALDVVAGIEGLDGLSTLRGGSAPFLPS